MAFKVKTTAPKFYCVRPNAALVAPGEQVQVQVILLGLAEEPTPDFKCRDKFLVITLPAPYDLGSSSVTEAWPQLEAEFKQHAVSKKIKVKYLLDGEEKSENVGVEPSKPESVGAASAPVASAPKAETQQETKAVVAKPEEAIKQPVSLNKEAEVKPNSVGTEAKAKTETVPEVKTEDSQAAVKPSSIQKQDTGVNSSVIVVVLLLALILGWMYH